MEVTVKIRNRLGLHARPAALLARLANEFQSRITVANGTEAEADARSILALLTLGAGCGAELRIAAEGSDADAALAAIRQLIDGRFDEE